MPDLLRRPAGQLLKLSEFLADLPWVSIHQHLNVVQSHCDSCNARKHAKAENIWVRLYIRDRVFYGEVEDDGTGFDVDAVQIRYDERGSLGMINMQERAELVDGKLVIASAPGEGTKIQLSIPLRGR